MLVGRVIVNATPNRYCLPSAVAWAALIAACGSRSGLLVTGPSDEGEPASPQGEPPAPGNQDAAVTPPDAPVSRDALPPVDVSVPPPNTVNDCPDAAATLVYVVSQGNALMSFYPPTATLTTIGTLSCPAPAGYQPFSMAVDRTGIAYVLYANNNDSDGQLFRVSTATASCRSTRFSSGQQGFSNTFGMAFVRDPVGGAETLYVADGNRGANPAGNCSPTSTRLATIDTSTFALNIVGPIIPTACSPELTGTAAGALFGFYSVDTNDSAIGQINPSTARLVSESRLNGVGQGHAWAFGFWGGDFYTFTAPTNNGSTITRFRPSDGSVVSLATTTETIVGAGVSTCAPQQ